MRVLYADADEGVRDELRRALDRESEAAELLTEETVDATLDRVDDGIDCVVVGNRLEDSAGVELLRELDDANPNTPVLFLTGADADLAAEAVSSGAVDYASKRVVCDRPTALVRRIRVAVERSEESSEERSEAHFRTMFERHSAPMLLIEPDSGEIRESNRAADEFYGYADLTAMKIDEINDFSPERVEAERKRAETQERNHFVFDHRLASGEVRTVEVHSSPVELDDERFLFSVIHDITERNAYRQELERYKELLDNVPVGVYRNTPGPDGTFVEVNPAMVSMFEADSEAELLDCAVSDLYVDETDREAVARRLTEQGTVSEHEIELETLDGERFWGSVSAITTTDDDGDRYFDGVIEDVTARIERERELERRKTFVEATTDVVTVLNDRGTIEYVSPSVRRVLGYRQDELEGETATEYAHPEDVESLRAFVDALEDADGVVTTECRFRDSDGSWCWLELRGNRVDDPAVEGVVLSGRDVTQRRRYERRLEEQNEMLELLNRVVRHDIRNDMQVVFGMLNRLEGHVDDDYEDQLQHLQNRANRVVDLTVTARDLMKTLLSSTRALEPVALDATLEREIDALRESFSHVDVSVGGDLPHVEVTADDMLGSVFANLLRNAVQHNDKEVPEVTVSVTERSDRVVVAVADNGPGVPDAQKEQLFEKGETGLESNGTGIGLFLVETLVDQYGGDVRVEDNEPTGAVFEVELPKVDAE